MSHAIQPIPIVVAYQRRHDLPDGIPVIHQVYAAHHGWQRFPMAKRISTAYARKLRAEGITSVALDLGADHIADFRIEELT